MISLPLRRLSKALIGAIASLLLVACEAPPTNLTAEPNDDAKGGGNDQGTGDESMRGFSWVVDKRLAGMPKPGASRDLAKDLNFLKEQRIDLLVSLTIKPTSTAELEARGIEILHLPVEDFTAPTLEQMHAFTSAAKARHAGARL